MLGRKRAYPLKGFLSTLILQIILIITINSLLIILLSMYHETRDFCFFINVHDDNIFIQNFTFYLKLMYSKMVDYTEPI